MCAQPSTIGADQVGDRAVVAVDGHPCAPAGAKRLELGGPSRDRRRRSRASRPPRRAPRRRARWPPAPRARRGAASGSRTLTSARCPASCHSSRQAAERCGRHGSASASSSAADGSVRQAVGALDRAADAEVADGEDVGPAEGEHQEHVRAPLADALDRGELGHDLLVGELLEAVELELAGEHVLGQRAQEGRLGAREADGDAQLLGLVGQDLLRRRRVAAEALEQAPVDRARRVHRELLADDRAHERGVDVAARRVAPRARRARRAAARAPGRRRAGAPRRLWLALDGARHAGVRRVLRLDLHLGPDVVHRLRRRRSPPRRSPWR